MIQTPYVSPRRWRVFVGGGTPRIHASGALAESWIPLTCKMYEAYIQTDIRGCQFARASILFFNSPSPQSEDLGTWRPKEAAALPDD